MRLGLMHFVKPDVVVDIRARSEASPEMNEAVLAMENLFHVQFDTLAYFPREALNRLHGVAGNGELHPGMCIASKQDLRLLPLVEDLTRLVNQPALRTVDRERYLADLLKIYQYMGFDPKKELNTPGTLVIGIEREGRILAERMGCLYPGRSLRPQAKRIHFDGGLVVGLGAIGKPAGFSRCVIIDGAIASGTTQITLMEHLRDLVSHFTIYSAHATIEGLRAIGRYARSFNIDFSLTVGHATPGLNDHFYAVTAGDPARLVVGDLGDTISPIA